MEFSKSAIQRFLKTKVFGREIHFLSQTQSTQTIASDLAQNGKPEGFLVVADQQTSGRGRHGHHWQSPPGVNLYFSLIFRPHWPMQRSNEIQFLCAVAAAEALKKYAHVEVNLKWPNDLRVGNKKIGGIILTTHAGDNSQTEYIVMGMGINLNMGKNKWPDELKNIATSVREITGKEINRCEFLAKFLQELESLYQTLNQKGFSAIRDKWQVLAPHMMGPEVIVKDAMVIGESKVIDKVVGKSKGINDQGHLRVETNDGKVLSILDGTLG